jgi:hypothetical protein
LAGVKAIAANAGVGYNKYSGEEPNMLKGSVDVF